jgi:hypothetical protein
VLWAADLRIDGTQYGQLVTAGDLLTIKLRLTNRSKVKLIQFGGWHGDPDTKAADEHGNEYRAYRFGRGFAFHAAPARAEADVNQDKGCEVPSLTAVAFSLHPEKCYVSYLYFAKPVAPAKEVRLTIRAKELGGEGDLHFKVPIDRPAESPPKPEKKAPKNEAPPPRKERPPVEKKEEKPPAKKGAPKPPPKPPEVKDYKATAAWLAGEKIKGHPVRLTGRAEVTPIKRGGMLVWFLNDRKRRIVVASVGAKDAGPLKGETAEGLVWELTVSGEVGRVGAGTMTLDKAKVLKAALAD